MANNRKSKKRLPILDIDGWLEDYESDLNLRRDNYRSKKQELLAECENLSDFANAHQYFGFHKTKTGWVYREWAPAAESLYLTGDFNDWNPRSHPLTRLENGNWEIKLHGKRTLPHQSRLKVIVRYDGEDHYKIPLYMTRVVQEVHDDGTTDFIGELWAPRKEFEWTDASFFRRRKAAPLIYEAHVGMAQEEGRIGTYREFADRILPRIAADGYNTVQLMAIMQHPYYGSFGYHVSNFYAVSSWFGTPDDLKYLVNKAHGMGLSVLMDLVHSHAVKNTNEGINRFDGSQSQFFYADERGLHRQWDSMCFNYGKTEVLHFLLSNLKYWLEEYHFDGFRFDGVTSMLYWNHGMDTAFDNYDKYFSLNTNTDAVTYLMLAADLVKKVRPKAVLVAEDMSGMPGLCLPISDGGIGFDYRLSMGVPDLWIKLTKSNDYDWDMHQLYYELTTHRPGEKRIAYSESHDQALVGDQTLFFRLAGDELYWHMSKDDPSHLIDRAIALHKMIRLSTIATGADGYLNFMGNEFGHPEWIDFPREGNNWSYQYARRQWSLVDNPNLKYQYLGRFDRDMLELIKEDHLLGPSGLQLLWVDSQRKIIAYRKNNYVFLYNFHPVDSYDGFRLPIHHRGTYRVVFSTDRSIYGGFDRIAEDISYETQPLSSGFDAADGIRIYIPSRTALVLRRDTTEEERREQLLRGTNPIDRAEDEEEQERIAVQQLIEAERIAQEVLAQRKNEEI